MFQFTSTAIQKALSPKEFKDYTESIFEQDTKQKPYDNDHYLNYTKSNFRWSKRMAKSFDLSSSERELLAAIETPIQWILLNEPWCGDGAFTQALLEQIATASEGKISLKILLRDKNIEVMNHFLTNGGMAIPKLIILNSKHEVTDTWGPRPKALQKELEDWKKEPDFDNDVKIQRVYQWYINDKNESAKKEIFDLIKKQINK